MNFVTLYNSKYLTRGLTLYESLMKYEKNFMLYIIAFDTTCYRKMQELNLDNVHVISLEEFEDEELLRIKNERTEAEYCWSSTAKSIIYVLDKFNLEECIYIDADLCFFNSPQILLHEVKSDDAVIITEHRYSEYCDQTRTSGKYCVQFMFFKNNDKGRTVLEWWKDRCIEWCYAKFEDGKFGDQKYLDDWCQRFEGVHELQHLGGGVAPWNVDQYEADIRDGVVYLRHFKTNTEMPLVFYHFHAMKFFDKDIVQLTAECYRIPETVIDYIYKTYVNLMWKVCEKYHLLGEINQWVEVEHCIDTNLGELVKYRNFCFYSKLNKNFRRKEMFFEEKVSEINAKLDKISRNSRILVWGAGKHTEYLFRYSMITAFSNIVVGDKNNWERRFVGKPVLNIREVDFQKVDVVIISTLGYQWEIERELKDLGFTGQVIKFYEKDENKEFYLLDYKNDVKIRLEGDYETWATAAAECTGYDEGSILDKVTQSTLAVLNGNAVYERGSVLFFEEKISYHLLFWIQMVAMKKESVTIVDLGGALGGTYLQNKELIKKIPATVKWYVVEQKKFVEQGKKIFTQKDIIFKDSVQDIDEDIDLLLLSGVLGYIENVECIIKDVLKRRPQYIIIDRTLIGERPRICIEKVPEIICQSSYPVRIFTRNELLDWFQEYYQLENEYHSYVDENVCFDDMRAISKGFVFKRKDNLWK